MTPPTGLLQLGAFLRMPGAPAVLHRGKVVFLLHSPSVLHLRESMELLLFSQFSNVPLLLLLLVQSLSKMPFWEMEILARHYIWPRQTGFL